MFSITWQYLTGSAVATHVTEREDPEWPPHPDRVYQALVASWGERGQAADERAALEWLEALPEPEVAAPLDDEAPSAASRIVYVPTNDMASDPLARTRKERRFPSVLVGDATCSLTWPGADAGLHGAALARLAAGVPRLGAEMTTSLAGRPTCAGTVENLGSIEVDVTARCVILEDGGGAFGPPRTGGLLADEQVAVGRLAPGAQQKFTRKMPSVAGHTNPAFGEGSIVHNLSAQVTFEVDGAPLAYLDLSRFDLATDWLRIMDALRADGFTLHTYKPQADPAMKAAFDHAFDYVELDGPDELADLPAAARRKLGKQLWKLIRDHYKRFKRTWPQRGVLVQSHGKSAVLRNGKLGAFK